MLGYFFMTAINWNDKELLQEAIHKSKSRVQVLKNLGYYPKAPISRRKLNDAIKKFDLDISHFTSRTERWDILPNIINNCFSIGDVLKAVGLQDQGDNFRTAKRHIKEMDLSTNHFRRGKGGIVSPYTFNQIFCENSIVHRSTAKAWILRENLINYSCAICHNGGEWRGEELGLRLDHINGVNNDNRLENLRFLCPNCDSQTPTYCGKNFGV